MSWPLGPMSRGLKPRFCGEFYVRAKARTYLRNNSKSKSSKSKSSNRSNSKFVFPRRV